MSIEYAVIHFWHNDKYNRPLTPSLINPTTENVEKFIKEYVEGTTLIHLKTDYHTYLPNTQAKTPPNE